MAAPISLQSFPLENSDCRSHSIIRDHYFNHAMTVILPGVSTVPNSLLESFQEQMTFKLHRLPLYRLIERPFIQAFVKKGGVHIISSNTNIATDDCVVVTPTGWLVLHLTKDTYEGLGLEAKKQTHAQKRNDTYVVNINLLADHFCPGKKGYERTLWCLKDRLDLTFDFLVSWDPHDDKVCPSSVGVYFTDKCEKVETVSLEKKVRTLTSLRIPVIDWEHPHGLENDQHFLEVFEWMGAIACEIDLNAEDIGSDSYTSTLTCPEPNFNSPRCCVLQLRGMITTQNILKAWKALREHTLSHPDRLPTIMSIHGFLDCPVKTRNLPHDGLMAGENLYSLLLLPNNWCWAYIAS